MWKIPANEELSTLIVAPSSSTQRMISDRNLSCGSSLHTLVEVSVTDLILRKFPNPRNPGGTEHAQTVCTRIFFFAHAQEPGNEASHPQAWGGRI